MGQPVHTMELRLKTGFHIHRHPKPHALWLVKEREETPPVVSELGTAGGVAPFGSHSPPPVFLARHEGTWTTASWVD